MTPGTVDPPFARLEAVAAIVGAALLLVGTMVHPMDADPSDLRAAFAEYARDPYWVASHLAQFLGIALIGVGLHALAAALEPGRAAAWARVGALGTSVSIAVAAVLQAVDGVALKVMVTRWMQADGPARARAFDAAVAVRQIEVGRASLLSLVFGLTMVAFALAIGFCRRVPTWLGALGLAAGAGTILAGVAAAYDGFSRTNMILTSVSGPLGLLWAVGVGAVLWRLAPRLSTDGPDAGEGLDATKGAS